jgi:hypothetical protein
MSIKTNSKLLLTVFLVGSLSGYVNASQDDKIEEEGSRLQITGAYNLLTAQIDAFQAAVNSSTLSAANLVAILGTNPVLLTTAVSSAGTTSTAYNAAMNAVSPLITTAMTTPNRTNILAIQTSINTASTGLLATAAALASVTSPYIAASVLSAANELDLAVDAWLAFYPA